LTRKREKGLKNGQISPLILFFSFSGGLTIYLKITLPLAAKTNKDGVSKGAIGSSFSPLVMGRDSFPVRDTT
jgi:hypothetical protein